MLSCCHSFYTPCIQSIITEGTGTSILTCPSCHQTTLIPKGGVTSLLHNLRLISKQSHILSKITSNPPPSCDSCSEDTSIAYCTECRDLLCEQCWDAHKKLRMSRTHSSFTFNEISPNNTTAVVPSHIIVGKEHKVKVVSRDSKEKELCKGGAIVSSRLVPAKEKGTPIEAKSTDCGDGTYLVSLIPQQLGEHELSLTIKGQPLLGSPINVSVVASRDYANLNKPVQSITGIITPWFIAIADNSDIFVTSYSTNSIYVLDSSGRQKAIIPCPNGPMGIAINGGIMYVAEHIGNKVSKFSLGGDFLGYFGIGGGHAQFSNCYDICIGPNNRMYVVDYGNQCIVIYHQDETFSHIISSRELGIGTLHPIGLSFDPSGHLHVTDELSNTVIVVTLEGQMSCQYGHFLRPHGIAIDSTGNSLVVNYRGNSFSIFDHNGKYIHSIGGLNRPVGVAVASNGSIWVTEKSSNRIVKY